MNYKISEACGKADYTVFGGDLNARLGNKPVLDIIGNNGEDSVNNNGKILIDICAFNALRMRNIYLRPKGKYINTFGRKEEVDLQ
jgi:hypothetical protein